MSKRMIATITQFVYSGARTISAARDQLDGAWSHQLQAVPML